MTHFKNVVIIGAGPAGLTAAYEILTKTDHKPIVLEASDMVGGIARTIDHNGNRIDLGGHRFFSKDDEVMKFWSDLLPIQGAPAKDDRLLDRTPPLTAGGPDPESDDRVMLVRKRISRIFYLRKFFDYPISVKPRTFVNMGAFRTLRVGIGFLWASIFKRREVTLRDFMINRFGAPLYKMFFEGYTTKVWGRGPEEISASWGSQRIRGISLKKVLADSLSKILGGRRGGIGQKRVETSLIEQFLYPKYGPGQLWETLAEEVTRLGREKFGDDYRVIRLGASVCGVTTHGGRVTQVVTNGAQGEVSYPADLCLSSMPVKDLIAVLPPASVPKNVAEAAGGLPYRDFMTVGLLLKKLNLKNCSKNKTVGNIAPDCWIYIQEEDVKLGRLQIYNNWSPYMVADWQNTVWVGLEYFAAEGDELWNMSESEFTAFAVDELSRLNMASKEDVLDSVQIKMPKAYPAYFDTYERFGEIQEYLDSVENLYCIGRNGQHRYNNMDHSMLTAMEAVRLIAENNSDKSTLWNVNADGEYNESKS